MNIKRFPKDRPYLMMRKGITPLYSGPGGQLLMRWDVSWRNFSGIAINTPRGCWWIYFRRPAA
jgi:hypothetical protein